jgi:hypothetical protein
LIRQQLLFRILVLSLALLAVDAPAGRAQEAVPSAPVCGKDLCIGVRSYARPFSYWLGTDARTDATSGPLSAAGYSGYMIRICDAVLQQMIYEGQLAGPGAVGTLDIDSVPPAPGSPAAESGDRLDRLGRDFDILCDPATITNTRRTDFSVSPPLFLTGVSILASPGLLPETICGVLRAVPDTALIGVVGGTTAGRQGVEALIRSGTVASLNAELNNYLAERTICDGTLPPDRLVRVFPTHPEAAKAFCETDIASGKIFYYLGDLEIITANAEAIPGCKPERPTVTYSNDRYAIFSRRDWTADHERALRIARFHDILARMVVFSPSLLDKAFQDTFIGQSPSRKLEVFFWSIRGELR